MIRTANGDPAVRGSLLEVQTAVVLNVAASVPNSALQGIISLQHGGRVLAETMDTTLVTESTGTIHAVTVRGTITVPAAAPVSAAGITVHAVVSVRQFASPANPTAGQSIESIEIYDAALSPVGLHDTVGVSAFPIDGVLYERPDAIVVHPPPSLIESDPVTITPQVDSTSPSRTVVHGTFDPG